MLQFFVYYYYYFTFFSCSVWIFFFRACFASFYTHALLPSSSVSLSHFVLAVHVLKCLGKHSCMSSPFPIAILNGTCFFPTMQLQVHNVYSERKTINSCSTQGVRPTHMAHGYLMDDNSLGQRPVGEWCGVAC